MAEEKETYYHVKIQNMGRAARVIHDGARPVQIGAGQTVDAVLSEETIKRLNAEEDVEGEPKLQVTQGKKTDAAPGGFGGGAMPHMPNPEHEGSHTVASGEENASHKRGPPRHN